MIAASWLFHEDPREVPRHGMYVPIIAGDPSAEGGPQDDSFREFHNYFPQPVEGVLFYGISFWLALPWFAGGAELGDKGHSI